MRRTPGLVVLTICLVLAAPLAYVLTAESWTEGLYDAESDDCVFIAKCSDVAIDCTAPAAVGYAPIVGTLALVLPGPNPQAAVLSALSPRAPPTSSASPSA